MKAFTSFAAVVGVVFLSLASARADTLFFQATSGPLWTNVANWYQSDGMGHLILAGRLPLATDNATIMTQVDVQTNQVQLQTLTLQPFVVVTNGAFIVQTLQMLANSVFSGSTITVDAEMDVTGLGCALRAGKLTIIGGAFAFVQTNGCRLTLSEGSLVSNQGEFILQDTAAMFSANSGATTNIFDNRPGARLRAFGNATVSGPVPGFVLTNSGVVRADSNTFTLQGMKWATTTGTNKFEIGVSDAAILFNDLLNVDAGVTFIISGPGVGRLGGGAAVQGILQIGSFDPLTTVFLPGNVTAFPFPAQIQGTGLIHVLGTNGVGSTLAITNAPVTQTTITIDAAAQLTFVNTETIASNVINNSGLIILTGPPSSGVTLNGGAAINNLPGGTFDERTDGPISGGTGTFNNAGTFRKSAGAGVTSLGTQSSVSFNNSGLLDIQSGSVNLFLGTNSGQFSTTNGSTLVFAGDFDVLNPGAAFTGGGLIQVNGAHPALIVNGNVAVPNLELDSTAAIDGPGHLAINGPFLWSGGTLKGNGTVDLSAASTTTVGALGGTLDQRTINNSGTFNWPAASTIAANNGAAFNNLAGALFNLQNDGTFTFGNAGTRPSLNNSGTVRKSAGTGTTTFNVSVTNSGLFQVNTQTVFFGVPYQQIAGSTILNPTTTISGAGVNISGGSLGGSGTISAPLNNSAGTVSPGLSPGILTIAAGNTYTQSVAGILNIELGGLTGGTQYDQLAVSGAANLNGSLNVSLVNGFVPSAGQQFTILTCASRTGTFPVKNGTFLSNNLVLMPVYSNTSVVLVVSNVTILQPPVSVADVGNNLRLTWPSVVSQPYQVEYSSDLFQWFVLSNLTANSTSTSVIDPTPIPGVPKRFYRLR